MNKNEEIKPYKYFESLDWHKSKTKRFWYKGQSIVTHFFNAISFGIPETERFLVKTIKPYLLEISEPRLKQELNRFILEENTHSLQHTKFNNSLLKKNYPIKFTRSFFKFGYKVIDKIFTKKTKLALVVCLEHMTAVLAKFGFNEEIMKENVCDVYDLFRWHAYEELNHKSIAFDLYARVGGGYIRRILAMLYTTIIFIFGVVSVQIVFILADIFARRNVKFNHFIYSIKFFLGRKGLIAKCFKEYISIYKINYIP